MKKGFLLDLSNQTEDFGPISEEETIHRANYHGLGPISEEVPVGFGLQPEAPQELDVVRELLRASDEILAEIPNVQKQTFSSFEEVCESRDRDCDRLGFALKQYMERNTSKWWSRIPRQDVIRKIKKSGLPHELQREVRETHFMLLCEQWKKDGQDGEMSDDSYTEERNAHQMVVHVFPGRKQKPSKK